MTPAQNSLYWREWGKTRARLLADLGAPALPSQAAQVNARRHALHIKALGRDKSHTAFTNEDFDKVLAAMRAIHDDANLNAQLRQLDQPDERRRALTDKCWAAARVFIHGNDQSHTDFLCDAYMTGITKKMWGKAFYEVKDERELGQLLGILDRRANQVLAKQRREHAEKVAAEHQRALHDD